MPVVETDDFGARLMSWHHCPACGGPDWVHIVGQGFWCDDCNTHATVRRGNCEGHILAIDTEHAWSEATNRPPEDFAHSKWFNADEGASPEWWGDGRGGSFSPLPPADPTPADD